jgi:hypothetical protein
MDSAYEKKIELRVSKRDIFHNFKNDMVLLIRAVLCRGWNKEMETGLSFWDNKKNQWRRDSSAARERVKPGHMETGY